MSFCSCSLSVRALLGTGRSFCLSLSLFIRQRLFTKSSHSSTQHPAIPSPHASKLLSDKSWLSSLGLQKKSKGEPFGQSGILGSGQAEIQHHLPALLEPLLLPNLKTLCTKSINRSSTVNKPVDRISTHQACVNPDGPGLVSLTCKPGLVASSGLDCLYISSWTKLARPSHPASQQNRRFGILLLLKPGPSSPRLTGKISAVAA